MPTQDEQKWIAEQYKCLQDERTSFDRYLWQVPIGAIGVIALLLGAVGRIGYTKTLACLVSLLSTLVCVYAALMVGRLHERKSKRCQNMLVLEKKMEVGTTIFDPAQQNLSQVNYQEAPSEKFVNRWFGSISTAVLGVAILIFAAAAALICCLYYFGRIVCENIPNLCALVSSWL